MGQSNIKRRLPILVLVAVIGLSTGCAAPPLPADRVESQSVTDIEQTRLGQAMAQRLSEHRVATLPGRLPGRPADGPVALTCVAREKQARQ